MFRIKTLTEIDDQCDRIVDYLDMQGRIGTSRKVRQLRESVMERILDTLGIDECDDDTLEMICAEPLVVGVSY